MRKTHAKPPLRSLQVFEAAARCGNFTAAGEELGITQSGVSRQISDLEATLGIKLFTRKGAQVSATSAGQRLAEQLAQALTQIRSAVDEATGSDKVVTLSMLPSVATRWFAPRLGRFMAAHPEIDLRITASRHLVDFAAEGIDAAIRYSQSPSPDLTTTKLADEKICPVCTPGYAQQLGLTEPDDLSGATLLHGDIPENWEAWFHAAGCTKPPQSGPRLADDTAILQAALDHQGVALGRSWLVADDIAHGRLIAPFETHLKASHSYWFVYPKSREPTEAILSVQAWAIEMFEVGDQDGSETETT
ncbi:transcriptional regulator GcvA [Ruegeria sp. R13_0]|uniref:transcriptional regulator GcvA n=1 Tax=Ruegeria sp. R13_0 TaxID=2821099 RepID=UPI001AD9C9BD|nr:transcriptional regulator GcvA [Ruegeria sp. R13_0]MBO9436400.1 transcriptional regulator GcvA [Ruegeria sp. R13_0]